MLRTKIKWPLLAVKTLYRLVVQKSKFSLKILSIKTVMWPVGTHRIKPLRESRLTKKHLNASSPVKLRMVLNIR